MYLTLGILVGIVGLLLFQHSLRPKFTWLPRNMLLVSGAPWAVWLTTRRLMKYHGDVVGVYQSSPFYCILHLSQDYDWYINGSNVRPTLSNRVLDSLFS